MLQKVKFYAEYNLCCAEDDGITIICTNDTFQKNLFMTACGEYCTLSGVPIQGLQVFKQWGF